MDHFCVIFEIYFFLSFGRYSVLVKFLYVFFNLGESLISCYIGLYIRLHINFRVNCNFDVILFQILLYFLGSKYNLSPCFIRLLLKRNRKGDYPINLLIR